MVPHQAYVTFDFIEGGAATRKMTLVAWGKSLTRTLNVTLVPNVNVPWCPPLESWTNFATGVCSDRSKSLPCQISMMTQQTPNLTLELNFEMVRDRGRMTAREEMLEYGSKTRRYFDFLSRSSPSFLQIWTMNKIIYMILMKINTISITYWAIL